MPTRRQIRDATPRCPGEKTGTANWKQCGRLLVWKHDHAAWACEKHGMILEPEPQPQKKVTA